MTMPETSLPVVWPFEPNWRESYHVTYEFKTDIIVSRSGKEQRRAQRSTPRKGLQFKVTLAGAATVALDRFMARYQNQVFLLPDLSRIGGAQEQGRLQPTLDVQFVTDAVAEADVAFSVTPGTATDDPGSPVEAWNGREVFPFHPNWSSPVTGSYAQAVDAVDFGRGVTQTYTPILFNARIRQFSVLFPTLADRLLGVAFFLRMKGQRGEFYMPTFQDDMRLAAPVAAGDTTLTIAGSGIYDTYATSTVDRAVQMQGFNRRVIAIGLVNGNSVIVTDVPWPFTFNAGTPLNWLLATRFAVDQVDMECVTDSVSRTQISVTSLEDLPVASVEDPLRSVSDVVLALNENYGLHFYNSTYDPLDYIVNVQGARVGGNRSLPRHVLGEY